MLILFALSPISSTATGHSLLFSSLLLKLLYISSTRKLSTVLQKHPAEPSVGRIYTVHPNAGASFYLRTLLHHVPGCDLELSNVVDEEQRTADQFTLDAAFFLAAAVPAICTSLRFLAAMTVPYDLRIVTRTARIS